MVHAFCIACSFDWHVSIHLKLVNVFHHTSVCLCHCVFIPSGTNKFASQKGMSMGSVRHVADIRADDMNQDGQGIVSLQSGKLEICVLK